MAESKLEVKTVSLLSALRAEYDRCRAMGNTPLVCLAHVWACACIAIKADR